MDAVSLALSLDTSVTSSSICIVRDHSHCSLLFSFLLSECPPDTCKFPLFHSLVLYPSSIFSSTTEQLLIMKTRSQSALIFWRTKDKCYQGGAGVPLLLRQPPLLLPSCQVRRAAATCRKSTSALQRRKHSYKQRSTGSFLCWQSGVRGRTEAPDTRVHILRCTSTIFLFEWHKFARLFSWF